MWGTEVRGDRRRRCGFLCAERGGALSSGAFRRSLALAVLVDNVRDPLALLKWNECDLFYGFECLKVRSKRDVLTKLILYLQMADKKIELYTPEYYAYCGLGGILSCGLTHTAVTPIDLLKCRKQVRR